MRLTDPLFGKSRGQLTTAIAYAKKQGAHRLDFVIDYLTELYRLCLKYGLDFAFAVGQADNESDSFTSEVFDDYGNTVGLGVTNSQNLSLVYANGKEMARAHFVHLWAYSKGTELPAEAQQWKELDPRYQAVYNANYDGTVKLLGDFNVNGRWAYFEDAEVNRPGFTPYGTRILNHASRIFGDNPAYSESGSPTPLPPVEPDDETITFGRVPMFGYIDRQHVTAGKIEGIGFDNLGRRWPKFIALHRMWGSLLGTDGYFGDPNVKALTDYGVGVEETDGAALAGVIYQWNDPMGFRSGWASGTVSAPYGDGKRIVDKYGVIAVNRDGVSLEISGKELTPIDAKAWQEIVHFCAWWADFMKVPYTSRVNPNTGINYLIWHEEFTIGTGKTCPFELVKSLTNRLYNDVATFLKPYQTGQIGEPEPPPTKPPVVLPTYAPPVPIAKLAEFSNFEEDAVKAVVTAEGHDYTFVNDIVRAKVDTPRLQRANLTARHTGPIIKASEEFEVRWIFEARDGRQYYVSPFWTRIKVEDTERVKDAA